MSETGDADTGRILRETFGLLGENLGAVLIFIAVVGGLTAIGDLLGLAEESGYFAGIGFGFMVDGEDTLASGLFQLFLATASVIASYLFVRHLLAERGRLRGGETRIWAYVGMSILSAIGIVLGFLLIIVPGIILMVRWSASAGYLMGERAGVVESLGQSWDATRDHGWSIFLAGLVLFVGFLVIVGVIGGTVTAVGVTPFTTVLSGLAEALGSALSLGMGLAVYLLVSHGTGEIEEVFA